MPRSDTIMDDAPADIESFSRSDLIELWLRTIGARPAKNLSSAMMRRILGFELQCQALGGHSASARRSLKIAGRVKKSGASSTPRILSVGTQLVREWNGRPYQVEVADVGFIMDGKTYRSLTAIAKKITGAHWSGPRFFGLIDSGVN